MTDDEEEVDISVTDGLLKPFLLDRILHLFNNRIVRIACKVVEEAESQDANALVLRRELLVSLGQRSLFPRVRTIDVEIGGKIVA